MTRKPARYDIQTRQMLETNIDYYFTPFQKSNKLRLMISQVCIASADYPESDTTFPGQTVRMSSCKKAGDKIGKVECGHSCSMLQV